MSPLGSPAAADGPQHVAQPAAAARHLATGALRVTLAMGLAVSGATAVAVSLSGASPRRTALGVLLVIPWALGWARVGDAAALLIRPGRTSLLALALGGLIAADGTWGSPFVAEGFVLVAVAVIVDDAAGLVACVTASVAAYLGGLAAGGQSPAHWTHASDLVVIANNTLDFPIVAGVLWSAITALRRVLAGAPEILARARAGEAAFTPCLGLALMAGAAPQGVLPPADPRALLASLTDAELRVATLLADGLAAKQIAVELAVGLSTVRTHIASAKRKTGARTLEQLAGIVARRGPRP